MWGGHIWRLHGIFFNIQCPVASRNTSHITSAQVLYRGCAPRRHIGQTKIFCLPPVAGMVVSSGLLPYLYFEFKLRCTGFSCAPLVLILATSDYTSAFFARTRVSICCGFHGDFLSSVCVETDRTWPVFLCRCQRSRSARCTDSICLFPIRYPSTPS